MWKQLIDFPDYEVSDKGEVRNIKKQRVLKAQHNGAYRTVGLKGVMHYVHALVLAAFVGPRPEGLWIRHLDGDGSNNCLSNLEYGTQMENASDRANHGTWGSKLKEEQVKLILKLNKCGISIKDIAACFSVHTTSVWRITTGKRWKYLLE